VKARSLAGLLALAGLLVAGVSFSSAAFTATGTNPGNGFGASNAFNLTVSLADPGAYLRGGVTLQANVGDGEDGSSITSVTIQQSSSGLDIWTDVCSDSTSPYSCSLDTTALTDGLYDLRAVVLNNVGGSATSTVLGGRRVDNTTPTGVTMSDPGSLLSGTVTYSGSASDAGSGVARVTFQYSPAGLGSWTDACSDATAPYGCSFDTTGLGDALYDFRALAVDAAGNQAASGAWSNRRVDNVSPSSALTNPGAYLRGTVTLDATASDGGGIADVRIQRSPAGLGSWTDVCTDTTPPYSCSFDTTGVTDGLYDFRAVATDNANRSTASAVVANRRVDNTAPTAADIQTANGGATAGRPETNDTITFTYSEQILSTSILAGWNGTSQAVTVRLNNNGGSDRLQVWNAGNTAQLPLTGTFVSLNGNFVQNNVVFNATMVQSGASITITLGTLVSGTVRTDNSSLTLSWPASATATDLAGNACSTATANETGAADGDF
jgi:hypothetical protein